MQLSRTTTPRRSRAVLAVGALVVAGALLSPSVASAEPGTAAEAMEQVRQAAQQLTLVDAQIDEAEVIVAGHQEAARAAAAEAADARRKLDAYEPQLRAIAQSGYIADNQSRVAAFLSSESATELVQQMATLDAIADHTNAIIAEVALLREAAELAEAEAAQAAVTAEAALAQLQAQQAEVQARIGQYESDFARLTAEEQAAVTTAIAGPTLAAPKVAELPVVPGSASATAIETALAQVGDPYVWGASGPDGFDCSGLTSYAYAAAGVSLPRASRSQATVGREVSRGELQPGDLVFFYDPISHVGLYIGNGQMVHARTFGQPVAVTTVDQAGYRFGRRLVG
ncbi:NlpC/P60 family protein [Blastococcus sp. MG754426]|uniref:C40 family peptidase n=1 Tax=unclassified Blastococcus TaxID=2619396 RepID=UPI001EEFB834|nr:MULTISPECIES: C40 family peptidase [unclassified Blastococcus]MCF6509073.1 NlpC/P60 family protein [Blastococcus sp. MG754426]MCF6513691.1 NlpC/P60 family protein [Blastococcus sp. MG754427]MCF6734225.1 NlpC/P60 family protein [Blastococcus sp. KM273129]